MTLSKKEQARRAKKRGRAQVLVDLIAMRSSFAAVMAGEPDPDIKAVWRRRIDVLFRASLHLKEVDE